MTSNRSLFNLKLFKEEYKKYIWATALTFLLFLFSKIILPLLDYFSYLREKNNGFLSPESLQKSLYSLNDYLTLDYDFNKLNIIILGAFIGTIMFSYLHNRKKVDFYHSLPISRNNLFCLKYLTGIVIVVPIMVIMHFLLYGIFSILLKDTIVSFKEVLEPVIVDIVFFIVFYSFTVFANILAGNSVIGVIVSGVLMNLISMILLLISFLSEAFFANIVRLNHILEYSEKYNPLQCYAMMENNLMMESIANINFGKANILITYIIISILLIVFSLLLFKVRKSEKSSTCLAFKYAKTIFKYLGVVIGGLGIGIVFFAIVGLEFALYLGIVLGCIIIHCIVEIIYDFDFRSIFKNWYSIIGCIAICIVTAFIFKFDIFGVKTYVPDISKIESINLEIAETYSPKAKDILDENIIQDINTLHQRYVDKIKTNSFNEKSSIGWINVDYKLKSGRILSRNVILFNEEDTKEIIKDIYNNKEYIEKSRDALYLDLKNQDIRFEITNNIGTEVYTDSIKDFDNLALREAIKKDVEKNGLYVTADEVLFSIDLRWYRYYDSYSMQETYRFYISDKYTNTLDYLARKNIKPENFKLEDVHSLQFTIDKDPYKDPIVIKDEKTIEKVLNNYVLSEIDGLDSTLKPASIILITKDDNSCRISISKELYNEIAKENNFPLFEEVDI